VELRGVESPVPAASIEMAFGVPPVSLDPICGLPMTSETATEVAQDDQGETVLFCSPSCVDTWSRRPLRAGSV
jgi:YHS domain-containing protein